MKSQPRTSKRDAPTARAIRFFRSWDAIRDRPVGRLLRYLRNALDPAVYALWYGVNRWSTRAPTTFNQKVRYKMIHDRRPVLTLFADKVEVRDHVERVLGPGYLPTAYQVRSAPGHVVWADLPREFVCKVSHASGGAIIVTTSADLSNRLPDYTPSGHRRWLIHPDAFDSGRAEELLRRWLETPYGWSGWKREWAYRDVKPRVLVEELLRGPEGGIPSDYKLYVFDGECRFIEVHQGRFERFVVDRYTRDWDYMPFDWAGVGRSGQPKPRPDQLDDTIRIAETLGAGIDFVRVDLYLLGHRIVFSELTHYPAGGRGRFEPAEYDASIGSWWKVPERYE